MMDPNNTNINPNWVGVSSKNNEEIDKTLLGGRLISKWQCSVCSCIYSSERVLKEHIEALHLNKFLCQCKDCGQSFKWRHQLQKHRQSCIARINNHFIENELTQNINNNIVT